MNSIFVAVRALLVAAAFLALWIWVAMNVRPLDPQLGLTFPVWVSFVGLPLMVLGCLLMLACIAAFVVRGEGTPAPFDPPRKFVVAGPYRYVRNPMYIGGFTALLGLGLYWLSLSVMILAIGWWMLFAAFVLLVEEPNLRRKFGEDYIAYCRKVPRWIPRFSR